MPRKKPTGTIEEVWISDLRRRMDRQYEMGFTDGARSEKNKILRQLGVVTEPPIATKKTPAKKKRKSPWDGITPEERARRIRKLRAAQKRWRASKAPAAPEPGPGSARFEEGPARDPSGEEQ